MLKDFITGYMEAALWSSNDDQGEPLDKNYSFDDIATETMRKMESDCEKFCEKNESYWLENDNYADSQAGHDFWLTRNGHGAGFWDRSELDDKTGKALTDASHAFGECSLYIGDDGRIYA